jgi:hypothetical protein
MQIAQAWAPKLGISEETPESISPTTSIIFGRRLPRGTAFCFINTLTNADCCRADAGVAVC